MRALFVYYSLMLHRGVISGHCLNCPSGMLPPKPMHIFFKFGLFRIFFGQKRDPTLVKSLFENTMGNPFFDFFKY